jgi:ribosome-binding factor A
VHEELSKLIVEEIEFPRETLVTITSVTVSKKLDYASVGVSVIPHERGDVALAALNLAKRELQGKLLRTINIKPMPQISFMLDYGPENAAAVEKALLEK